MVRAEKTSGSHREGRTELQVLLDFVQPGDTLAMLAVRFQVSAATLRSANNLKTDELKVGQVLTIPGTELAAQ